MSKAEPGNELVTIHKDELSELTSFDEAISFLQSKGYEVGEAADLLGDGFAAIEKKDLMNIPFIIVDAVVTDSKDYMGSQFAVVRAVTATNKRVRFSDGSVGIKDSILQLESKRKGGARGVVVPQGLTASEYKFCPDCERAINEDKCEHHPNAKVTKGETFYFAV